MASLNKVQIIGNLGRDPDSRFLPSGDAITNIAVATTSSWKDKATGDKREETEWHRITAFGKLAEIMNQYLKKGSQVYIEGSLKTRKYTDKDGVEKYATEIKADSMQMLGSKQGGNAEHQTTRQPTAQQRTQQQQTGAQRFDEPNDEIPFANPYRGKISLSV